MRARSLPGPPSCVEIPAVRTNRLHKHCTKEARVRLFENRHRLGGLRDSRHGHLDDQESPPRGCAQILRID